VDNWKNMTNSQNSVRKKSFGGTFSFSNCHIIEFGPTFEITYVALPITLIKKWLQKFVQKASVGVKVDCSGKRLMVCWKI
jgi:hypothetical protein